MDELAMPSSSIGLSIYRRWGMLSPDQETENQKVEIPVGDSVQASFIWRPGSEAFFSVDISIRLWSVVNYNHGPLGVTAIVSLPYCYVLAD
jgi:hypothetical protein